jgi:4-hydroxy-tetrahydrodipicolinate reductase
MDIALIGYGKMGQEVEKVALGKGHKIVARIDPAGGVKVAKEISAATLADAQVCIEFSHPAAVLENIKKVLNVGKPMVVGTTGWYSHLPEVRQQAASSKAGLVYAPNFSLGVNLFYLIAERAAALFNPFDAYDAALTETHHCHKVDSPSGTAKQIAEIVLKNFTRKKRITSEPLNRAIEPDELNLVSIRAGEFPGTHTLLFDSLADTIELTHTARSRAGFAMGAVVAAEWVAAHTGVFAFDQVLQDLLSAKS